MTDSAQTVVNRYAYDSFGALKSDETVRNAYAYTGREYDSETGLYYYRARYYDPEAGRFVSKDPIGFNAGDVNLYGYVAENSVNLIDPWGLTKKDKWYGYDDKNFQDWIHGQKGSYDPDIPSKEKMKKLWEQWNEEGRPGGKGWKSGKGGQFKKPRGFKCVWWLSLIELGVDAYDAWEQYKKCKEDPCICDVNCI